MYCICLLLLRVFYDTMFMIDISKYGFYLKIKNKSVITNLLKNMVLLLKYTKLGLTSNNLIQIVYLELDEDGTFEDKYFTNMLILSIQNYNIDDLKKHTIDRFLKFLCDYFSINMVVIEDGANNNNCYPTKSLNSLSILRLPLFNLELKIKCSIMLLQNIAQY